MSAKRRTVKNNSYLYSLKCECGKKVKFVLKVENGKIIPKVIRKPPRLRK